MTLTRVTLILFDKKHVINNNYYFNLYIYIFLKNLLKRRPVGSRNVEQVELKFFFD